MEMEMNMMGWRSEDCYQVDRRFGDLVGLLPGPWPRKTASKADAKVGGWRAQPRELGLCTESLGSESSFDDGSATEEEEEEERTKPKWVRRREEEAKPRKQFPPPLPSLVQGGGGTRGARSVMKAQRKDGRLVITEMVIRRPEILRATREDGRLRLQLVARPDKDEVEAEQMKQVHGEEEEGEKAEGEGWRWTANGVDGNDGDGKKHERIRRFLREIGCGGRKAIEEFWRNNPPYATTA